MLRPNASELAEMREESKRLKRQEKRKKALFFKKAIKCGFTVFQTEFLWNELKKMSKEIEEEIDDCRPVVF